MIQQELFNSYKKPILEVLKPIFPRTNKQRSFYMKETVESIVDWGRKTFPESTLELK